jgi:membrane-associated PAP2 superfamily phosphatase
MLHRRTAQDFLLPLALLLAGTALIAATGLDLTLEGHFYRPGLGWAGREGQPWRFLYDYGRLPGYLLGAGGGILFGASYISPAARAWRKQALFLVLLLALGPGLLVNTVFKEHWGRPRPSHLQVFGGVEQKAYHQVWERGVSGTGKSFPSGHAAAAFYLVAPYFVLRRRFPGYARLALAFGLCYGLIMGVARMAQGGHFPSDVLWAGGIVYLTGALLSRLLGLDAE